MRRRFHLFAASLMMLVLPAMPGQAIVAAELWEKCLSEQNAGCNGYIVGVSDAAVGEHFCPPTGWTSNYERLIDIGITYLRDNKDLHYLPAALLVVAGLKEAFPCEPPATEKPDTPKN